MVLLKRSQAAVTTSDNQQGPLITTSLADEAQRRKLSLEGFWVGLGFLVITARASFYFNGPLTIELPQESPSKLNFITVVIPSVVDVQHRSRRLDAIVDTWAQEARALLVVHDLTEEYPTAAATRVWNYSTESTTLIPPVDTRNFPQILQLPSNITANHGFDRLEFALRHVYEKHVADYVFLVNDHSFVISHHLCRYLRQKSKKASDDLYAGHAMKHPSGLIFHTGAAGYIMSRHTMHRLIQVWNDKTHQQHCRPTSDFLQTNPDLVIADCLQTVLHVSALDTRDRGHVFHTYGLVRTATSQVDDWFWQVHRRFGNDTPGFDDSYQHSVRAGGECCSSESISFHYVEYAEARALHSILHSLLQNPLDDWELQQALRRRWPTKDLGGYSKPLPEGDSVKQVLEVLRKIAMPSTSQNDHDAEIC
jgi:hypothetical protein